MCRYDAAIQNSWRLLVRIWKGTWCEGDVGRFEAINCTHTQHTLIDGLESRVWYMFLLRFDHKWSRKFHWLIILSRPVIFNLLQFTSHHSYTQKTSDPPQYKENSFLKINIWIMHILVLLLETLNNLRIVTIFFKVVLMILHKTILVLHYLRFLQRWLWTGLQIETYSSQTPTDFSHT